jgi:hypothetical protein
MDGAVEIGIGHAEPGLQHDEPGWADRDHQAVMA